MPFDEVRAFQDGALLLASGDRWSVPAPLVSAATRALSPPVASGCATEDAATLHEYLAGPWSPARACTSLLSMAAAAGASDVHVEGAAEGFGVRLRVAGELSSFVTLPRPQGARLVAALKHRSGCLPYRSDIVQEGRIARPGVAADVRASFLPTALGERAALRLFGRLMSMEELGLDADLRARFEGLLGARSGLVLVAGSSGAGKTTTVYAALAHLAAHRPGAHLSIEDPVEQRLRIAGIPVDQVELCVERGLTAEAALVGALRQDIDVVALAEVRTEAEARLALRAAHTGRLVLAGIHAGSAAEARRRMLDLGAEPAVLDVTLRGVLHQGLESRPCPDGAGRGCGRCGGTGRVRRPVAALWLPGEGEG